LPPFFLSVSRTKHECRLYLKFLGDNKEKGGAPVNSIMFFLLSFCYLGLFIWGVALGKKQVFFHLSNVILLVVLALIYDNFVLAAGKFIGEGSALEQLNTARFWLHALFTPLLILFAWSMSIRADFAWAKRNFWKLFAFLLTLGLIVYEFITSVRGLELKPKWEKGTLSYENVASSHNPVMVITVTLVLAIVGFLLARKRHNPWLLSGVLFMLIAGVFGIWIRAPWFMNTLELGLMASILLTKQKFQTPSPS